MMSALASASRFASSALFDFLNGLILSRKLSPSPAARGRSTRRAEWRGVLGYAGHPCVTTRISGTTRASWGRSRPDLDAGQARGVGASQHLDVARQVSCGVPRTERACDARAGRDEAHGALCAFHPPRGGRVSQRICVLRSIGPTKISCSDSCLCVTTRTRHSAPLRGKAKWVRPRALDAAHTTRRTFSDLETPRLSRRAPIGKGRVCTFGEARRIDPQFVRPPPTPRPDSKNLRAQNIRAECLIDPDPGSDGRGGRRRRRRGRAAGEAGLGRGCGRQRVASAVQHGLGGRRRRRAPAVRSHVANLPVPDSPKREKPPAAFKPRDDRGGAEPRASVFSRLGEGGETRGVARTRPPIAAGRPIAARPAPEIRRPAGGRILRVAAASPRTRTTGTGSRCGCRRLSARRAVSLTLTGHRTRPRVRRTRTRVRRHSRTRCRRRLCTSRATRSAPPR